MSEFDKLLAHLQLVRSCCADPNTVMKAIQLDILEMGKRLDVLREATTPADRRPELRKALMNACILLSAAVAVALGFSAHDATLAQDRLEAIRAAVLDMGA